jgi:DNA-binding SARP family transcriptional activator
VAVLDLVDPQRETRWKLLFATAERLGITAIQVATGTPDVDPCLAIGPEHEVAIARPQRLLDTFSGTQLFRLAAVDAQALLEPLAANRADIVDRREAPTANGSVHVGQQAISEAQPSRVDWPTAGGDVRTRPINVRVLGPINVNAWGREVKIGLRDSARELLTWYLLHPDGAPAETAIEAIWPDAPPDRGPQRFWNALGNLRSRLKGPSGEHVDVLTKVGDVYRPNTEEIDADIWQFQSALAEAARGEIQPCSALQRAAELYADDFAGTASYLWLDPVREELHRRALDVHVRLAELHDEQGDTQAAVEILERAIALDPVAEDVYRRLIRLLARGHRRDGVERLWAQLQTRLADIDAEPEPVTLELVRRLRSAANPVMR